MHTPCSGFCERLFPSLVYLKKRYHISVPPRVLTVIVWYIEHSESRGCAPDTRESRVRPPSPVIPAPSSALRSSFFSRTVSFSFLDLAEWCGEVANHRSHAPRERAAKRVARRGGELQQALCCSRRE